MALGLGPRGRVAGVLTVGPWRGCRCRGAVNSGSSPEQRRRALGDVFSVLWLCKDVILRRYILKHLGEKFMPFAIGFPMMRPHRFCNEVLGKETESKATSKQWGIDWSIRGNGEEACEKEMQILELHPRDPHTIREVFASSL